jgi:hypothetical protein
MTALRDGSGFQVPSGLVGPLCLKSEHDDVDTILILVFEWWRVHEERERSQGSLRSDSAVCPSAGSLSPIGTRSFPR